METLRSVVIRFLKNSADKTDATYLKWTATELFNQLQEYPEITQTALGRELMKITGVMRKKTRTGNTYILDIHTFKNAQH
jgi:hypothetical protein